MDSPVEQIKDKLSITDVVGAYVQLKKAGRNYTARCPFHKERTPSFMVSPERGTYMCFGCGEKGDIFSFIEKIEGVDFKGALTQLAQKAGVELPKFSSRPPREKEKEERLREVCEAAASFFEEQLQSHTEARKYVSSRGVHETTIQEWCIGYAPAAWDELCKSLLAKGFAKEDLIDAGLAVSSEKKQGEIFDRFRGRIMFPLFDVAGAPIAFSGRFFEKVRGSRDTGEPAKYVNSPETALFKKSRVLYGLNFARDFIRKADCLLLVEGQFDVVLSHQSGLKFALAVSGTALTQEHLSLMGRYSKRLVLALDNDDAGLRAGFASARMALAAGFDVKIPNLAGGKDPAELAAKDPEMLKAAVRSSQPAVEFFLEMLRPFARDERGYQKLVEAQVLPLIAVIPSKIDQSHFISLVARALHVPEDAVRAEVGKQKGHRDIVLERVEKSGAEAPALSSLEKSSLLLLSSLPEESPHASQLKALLGEKRFNELHMKVPAHLERLQFEFDSMGEDAEVVAEALLAAVERAMLQEHIAQTRISLSDADRSGDGTRRAALMKKLSELTRRREEMRK